MRTSTRNTSKVKQSRPKSSKPTLSQLTCTATDLCRLGEARSLNRIRETSAERQGDAFATFRFRYRTRSEFSYECSGSTVLTRTEDLQTLCLIPRSPSPIPLEDRPEETLTREELLEAFRKQKVCSYSWRERKEEHHTDSHRLAEKSRLQSRKSSRESASKMRTTMKDRP
jgi:hypothetical protein